MTLLGPSGSGKTTLLMVLAGFTRPDHGSIKFGEAEVIRMPPHRRDVGMVFQNYALFPHMSVAANVAFPLKLRKVSKAEIEQRVEQTLETVQLGGYGERRIDQLSGGQRQRVALARAIVFEPLLDYDCFGIPKGAPNKDLAMKFIAEMSKAEYQADMPKYITYGPTNRKAYEIGKIDPAVAQMLPSFPENAKIQLVLDVNWWAENEQRASAVYQDMLTE